MKYLKQIQLLLLACMISSGVIAGRWENYNNFSQITDVQPNGFQSIVSAKGGVLVVNQLTAEKKFFNINNSALPSNSVEQVAKSSLTGDIWIGTYDNGLARFTGTDFIPVAYPSDFGLLLNMKFGSDGFLYLQSTNGAFKFNTSSKSYKQFNTSITNEWLYDAWSFDFASSGNVAVFTGANCYFVNPNTSTIVDSFDGIDGPLVFGCSPSNASLYYIDDNTVLLQIGNFALNFLHRDASHGSAADGLPAFSDVKVIRGTDQNLYAFIDGTDVYKLVGSAWIHQYNLGAGAFALAYFYEDGTNGCFASEQSADVFTHNLSNLHMRIDARKYAFDSNNMNSVFVDNSGDIFTLTSRNIYKLNPLTDDWSLHTTAPGIFGVARDARSYNGNIYVINYGNLLAFYDGSTWTQVPMAAGASSIYVYDYAVTPTGTIYFYNTDGLLKYEAGTTSRVLPSVGIHSMTYDKYRNSIWYTSGNKVCRYDIATAGTTEYTNSSYPNLPSSININCISVNPRDQSVWFGGQNSMVLKFDGSDFTTYTVPTDLHPFVTKILFDGPRELFKLSDADGGFYTLEGSSWTRFNVDVDPTMPSASYVGIAVDQQGNYWLSHEDGNAVSVYRKSATAIESVTAINALNVYPNPAQDEVLIENPFSSNQTMRVISSQGDIVSQLTIAAGNQIKINTSGFSNGVYFIQVGACEKKLMIQH